MPFDPVMVERQRGTFGADDARSEAIPAPVRMTKRSIFDFPVESLTLKRIAWAFGCAEKGSVEEGKLAAMLLRKVETERAARAAPASP